jgi:tetratricopeptide (TPR) repeat protein
MHSSRDRHFLRWRKLLCAGGLFSLAISCVAQQKAVEDSYAQHLRDGVVLAARGDVSSAMGQIQAAIALHPDDAAGWYQLGSLLGQTGDFPDAGAAFRHAISLQPAMAKAHYGLALTLIGNPQDTEDWAGAVAECREALKHQPAYPEALNLMGVGLSKQGQYAAAINALEQAIQLSPAYPEAHFNLGLALESNDRLDDAVEEYRAAISAKGQYPEASSALGKLLLRMGKPAAAKQEVTTALHSDPDLTDAHYTRARILQSLHRNQEASTEFAIAKELTERPADGIQSSQMSNQALTTASKGDLDGATAVLRKAIALKPDYGLPHFNLGLILADQSNTTAAIQELSKAISLLPGQALPWFELGRVLEVAKDDRGAMQTVAWAAHLAPSNAQIKAELARLQASASIASDSADLPAAVEPPAFGARTDTAEAHIAFAQQLTSQRDFQGAIGELLRALTLQPAMQDARRDLAEAYENLGDHDRAVLEYRKLLVSFPADVMAHIALGKILLAQGDARDAAEQFKQALIYQPTSVEAQAFLRKADALARQH